MLDSSKLLASKQDLNALKEALKEDIVDLRVNLAATKADLIKWMFVFWIGQVAVTFGFILLFLNK